MPNEPVFQPASSRPAFLRNKRLPAVAAIIGLVALLVLGHCETQQPVGPPAPVQRATVASMQPDPPVRQQPVQTSVVQQPQEPAKEYAQVTPQPPPEKSKIEQAQDELHYRSLYGATVVAQPISVNPNKDAPIDNLDAKKGGREDHLEPGRAVAPDSPSLPADKKRNPLDFDPNQPLLTLPEGTIIETVLTNKIEGEMAGPVDCMITTDVYAPTRTVVIPQGSRVIGEASKVAAFGQQRLAVTFHRIIVPGPPMYSIPLDVKDPGLDQQGAVGIGSPYAKVNSHFMKIFGASMAIGLIGGLSQIGTYAGSGVGYSPTYGLMNGFSESTAESSSQVLSRFLNLMPTIEIRPGVRVKVVLAADLSVPATHTPKESTDARP